MAASAKIRLAGPEPFVLYGGSFNPPGLHHAAVVAALAERFDRIRLLPCGFRGDKAGPDWLPEPTRRRLIDLAFAPLVPALAARGVELSLDYRDLDRAEFTTTYDLAALWLPAATPHFVVGADLLAGGGAGRSPIQTLWHRGDWIWRELHWICLERPGYPIGRADLPPRATVVECAIEGSSSRLRARLRAGQGIEGLASPAVAEFCRREGLYR